MLTVRPTATAPGLLLRSWTEQDIPAMVEAHRDPTMRQWLRHPVTTADRAPRIIQARRASRPLACHGTGRWKGWNSSTASATTPPAG
jgi:hypothetical protein